MGLRELELAIIQYLGHSEIYNIYISFKLLHIFLLLTKY